MADDIAPNYIDTSPFDEDGNDGNDGDDAEENESIIDEADDVDDLEDGVDVNEVDIEDIDDLDEKEVSQIQINESDYINRIPDNERISNNLLTKYEKTRIIYTRAEQIARGEAPTINTKLTDSIEIAEEELKQGKIPFKIRRYIGAKYEEWNIKDLINF